MALVQQFCVSNKCIFFHELLRLCFSVDMKTSACVFITSLPQRQWDHPVKIQCVYKYATKNQTCHMLGEQTVQFPCQSQHSSFSLYNQRDIHMHTIYLKPWQIKANAQQMSKCSLSSAENASKGSCQWITKACSSPLVVPGRLNNDIIRTRTTADCHGRLLRCKK